MEKISIKLTDTSGKRPCPAELVWVEWPTSCHIYIYIVFCLFIFNGINIHIYIERERLYIEQYNLMNIKGYQRSIVRSIGSILAQRLP